MTYRGRFAPSPTGDLHLGGARTALVAWLAARAAGGTFVVRVEDLDRARAVAGAEQRILDDLAWLGIDWDEGPDRGGPFSPYRQSDARGAVPHWRTPASAARSRRSEERGGSGPAARDRGATTQLRPAASLPTGANAGQPLDRYESAIQTLLRQGRAYPCFCSRAEVARAAQAPHGPGDDGPRYPGTCRDLSQDEIDARAKTRRPAIRLRVEPEVIAFTDGVHGARQEDVAAAVGDFVISRADGVPAYQLAVVVDDAFMRMTDVVRGDDLLGSTARQLYLHRALDLSPPSFAHVPLVLGPDGARLSKRHGAIGVRRFADPERLVGALAHSLGLIEDASARLHPRALITGFDLSRLRKTAAIVDPTRFT
jgi:glutamyl-tRNA synthetase